MGHAPQNLFKETRFLAQKPNFRQKHMEQNGQSFCESQKVQSQRFVNPTLL